MKTAATQDKGIAESEIGPRSELAPAEAHTTAQIAAREVAHLMILSPENLEIMLDDAQRSPVKVGRIYEAILRSFR